MRDDHKPAAIPPPSSAARRTRLALVAALLGILGGLSLSAWLIQRLTAPELPGLPTTIPARSQAPEFALPALDGNTVKLSSYRGRVVLVNFWASWCVPCQEEIPTLQAAYQALQAQDFVVVGVNLRDRERPGAEGDNDVRDFVQRFAIDYPLVIDQDGAVGQAYRVSVIPTSFLLDREGKVREVRIGIWRPGELEALVEAMQR